MRKPPIDEMQNNILLIDKENNHEQKSIPVGKYIELQVDHSHVQTEKQNFFKEIKKGKKWIWRYSKSKSSGDVFKVKSHIDWTGSKVNKILS